MGGLGKDKGLESQMLWEGKTTAHLVHHLHGVFYLMKTPLGRPHCHVRVILVLVHVLLDREKHMFPSRFEIE